MDKNGKLYKPGNFLTDMVLTVLAVGIVGLTYFGVSGLTPASSLKVAQNNQAVLGISTKQKNISYFPGQTSNLPFIQDAVLSDNTSMDGNATISVKFSPLEASTYEFIPVTIKNSSMDYKKVSLNPYFSLQGSYTSISVTYAGHTSEIVSSTGTVTPVDMVLPPSSSSDIKLTIQPVAKLATPVTLNLDFVEAE